MVADGIEVVDQLTKIGDYQIISDHPVSLVVITGILNYGRGRQKTRTVMAQGDLAQRCLLSGLMKGP